MIVYLDLIFLMNLVLDGALLLATAWTRKLVVRWWRIACASVIGASYAVMMLFPELSALYTFAVKFLFSAAMVVVAFGFGKLPLFLRNIAAFYLVSFALAGGIFGIHYFLLPAGEVMNGILFTHTGGLIFVVKFGFWFIVLLFPFLIWFTLRIFRSAKQRHSVSTLIAEVEVRVDQFSFRCKGLVDTGNQLYDPLTKTPVMIMEAALWKDAVPEAWMKKIQSADVEEIVTSMGLYGFFWQDRLRIVPYRGVNRATQFMLAIKPDSVKVMLHEKTVESGKVLIGFDGGTLSSDGSYQAIIHPMLLED